jgi:hypothetical protein
VFFIQMGRPTTSSQWIHGAYAIKQNAASRPGRKLLLAGGSNILFGIKAERLEKELGIPTVNFGVHAGLGADYILHQAKKALRAGDSVILALEYHLLLAGQKPTSTRIDYLLAVDNRYFWSLPLEERAFYVFSFKPDQLLKRAGLSGHETGQGERGYDLSTINGHGDETKHQADAARQKMLGSIKPVDFSPGLDPAILNQVRDFARWCAENNIRLLVTFPSFLHFPDYERGTASIFMTQLSLAYASLPGAIVLGSPRQFMYPIHMFYDTFYHLNHDAAQERTQVLADLLREHGL